MIQKKDNLKFLRDPKFIILVFFLLINIFFIIQRPGSFFQVDNYLNMLKQAAMIIIVAAPATLLMMTGNFDLSTGGIVAFTSVIYALLVKGGMPLVPAGIIAIVCGTLIGVINGTLVSKFNFPPFIATLGMMYISRGIALILANGTTVRENMPPGISYLASNKFFGIPIFVYFVIIALAVFIFLEKKTLLGKYAMAIGGNQNAAFFSGINAAGVILLLYIIVGTLSGFSGIMTASRLSAGDPRGALGFEFDVILAILLGGTSLSGGKGSVIGTFIGALVVTVLGNGLDMLNILTFWQSILKGIIFVAAIVLHEKILKNIGKKGFISQKTSTME